MFSPFQSLRYEQSHRAAMSFPDAQECHLPAAKCSDMSSVVHGGRFADFQELRFQPPKHSDMSRSTVQVGK